MKLEDLLSTTQAAQIAHKHQRTIVAWIRKGKLKALKMPGGRGAYLIDKNDLEAVMAKMYTPRPYKPGDNDHKE